jgi:hypothetical protein
MACDIVSFLDGEWDERDQKAASRRMRREAFGAMRT